MSYDFMTTRWTLVMEAAGQSEEARGAMDTLCRAYWPPLFAYVRGWGLSHADAEDMTQAFFQHLLVNQTHTLATPERGRFRSYLLTCLKNFMANEHRSATAEKRGGKATEWLPIEDASQDVHEALGSPATPEMLYEKQFAHTMLSNALEQLRQKYIAADSLDRFEAMKPLLFGGGYGAQQEHGLAARLGSTDAAARKALDRLRQHYGEIIRREVARLVTDPSEIDDEISHLMRALKS